MAMGKRRKRDRQASMWVATADLPTSAGHPFYARLNRVLDDAGFDTFIEAQCEQFYADGIGRPSLAPGRYFRLLLLVGCRKSANRNPIAENRLQPMPSSLAGCLMHCTSSSLLPPVG